MHLGKFVQHSVWRDADVTVDVQLRVASTAGQEGMLHIAPGVHFRQRSVGSDH